MPCSGFIDRKQAEEICEKWRLEDLQSLRDNKITIGMLRRCLKIYDPHHLTFWNAKRLYKEFHNDMGLLVLKLEALQKSSKEA